MTSHSNDDKELTKENKNDNNIDSPTSGESISALENDFEQYEQEENKNANLRKYLKIVLITVIVLTLIALIVFGCWYFNKDNTANKEILTTVATTVEFTTQPTTQTTTTEPTTENTTVAPTTESSGTSSLGSTYTSSNLGFTVNLPQAWREYGTIIEYEDSVHFYHKASYDTRSGDNNGHVFAISKRELSYDYTDLPSSGFLAETSNALYYWSGATAVTYNQEISAYRSQYDALYDSKEEIFNSFALTNSSEIAYDPYEDPSHSVYTAEWCATCGIKMPTGSGNDYTMCGSCLENHTCTKCNKVTYNYLTNGLCDDCNSKKCLNCGTVFSIGLGYESDYCGICYEELFPNVWCPNCGAGSFVTGVGLDGLDCLECGHNWKPVQ